MLPLHRQQALSEGDAAMLLRSIGLELMSDFSPGFGEVCTCTVDDGDGETPVVSSSDTASTRSGYCSSEYSLVSFIGLPVEVLAFLAGQ